MWNSIRCLRNNIVVTLGTSASAKRVITLLEAILKLIRSFPKSDLESFALELTMGLLF